MKEIWKPIKDYENYEASTCGRIRNTNFHRSGQTKVLTPGHSRKYPIVQLFKDGIGKWFHVHKLIAETFIPNPNNLPQVNHKDENPDNNCVENLEYCDAGYNSRYGTRTKRLAEKLTNRIDESIVVGQFTQNNKLVAKYPSISEASRIVNVDITSISKCCKEIKKYKTAGGYKWAYIQKSTIQLDDAPCSFEISYAILR